MGRHGNTGATTFTHLSTKKDLGTIFGATRAHPGRQVRLLLTRSIHRRSDYGEFREMTTQPSLERALRHKEILGA